MIFNMEKGLKYMLKEKNIMDSFSMGKNMEKGNLYGLMALFIMDNLKIINWKV